MPLAYRYSPRCRHAHAVSGSGPICRSEPLRTLCESPSVATRVAASLFLHPLESRVVVRELAQVSERDLPRHERIVVGHVGEAVVEPVLELHVHPHPELLDVEGRRGPVDADLLTDPAGLLRGEARPPAHQTSAGCSTRTFCASSTSRLE